MTLRAADFLQTPEGGKGSSKVDFSGLVTKMLFDQIASNKPKTGFVAGFLPTLTLIWLWLAISSSALSLVVAGLPLIIGLIYALTMIFQSTEIVMSMNGR